MNYFIDIGLIIKLVFTFLVTQHAQISQTNAIKLQIVEKRK